ncbi:GntR family transcriptional regulator [Primorskyibacter sedentarius]|uniref:GntR family transcriptional regulator n=1 Tax=Primorskyibacter sedentarius TaxID=745311 RepID=A0A4R3J8M0_9RHOB|nr:GntR family transcriptional regulator [Primorskyibacter sedentarius]
MKPSRLNPASSRSPQSDTAADRDVLTRLRTDIVTSVLEPGTRLKFADMTKRYDVGIGTLREALSQLSSEGFVTVEVGKGFKVAPVSAEELVEITDHFINFEKRAVREAIEHGDDDWEANIVAVHHRLSLIEGLPWERRMERHSEWVERHRDFHEAIVAACQGRWLFRLRSIMFDQLDRYRFVTKRAPEGLGGRKYEEHGEIMAATLARDADLASSLIEHHIRDTSERAIKLL